MKRTADAELDNDAAALKRARGADAQAVMLSSARPEGRGQSLVLSGPKRTSGLAAPIMQLAGHGAEVFAVKFSPNGEFIASGSADKSVFLWHVYGECQNYCVLNGHKNAVLDVQWSTDGTRLFTASADKFSIVWDAEYGERLKTLRGHESFVNAIHPARRGPPLVVTGSDDGTVKMWDSRLKYPVHSFDAQFPVLGVSFSDTAEQVFSAGIDGVVKVWDVRRQRLDMTMPAHDDAVTGLTLSPDGSYVLTNSMDNTVRVFDVRPFVAENQRCVKIFTGIQHGLEKNMLRCAWSHDGSKVAAGSAESPSAHVYVWDTATRRILYKLPGHKGSVNAVDFHPSEPILASCSSDKTIFLGELDA